MAEPLTTHHVLARAAALLSGTDVIAAIGHAAGGARSDAATDAYLRFARHLGYPADGAQRNLRRWSQIRTREEVLFELQAAAQAHAPYRGAPELAAAPAYPAPGSEIPDQPGYVVGTCGHRVAGSEWRAGFRTCERCPSRGGDA